MKALPLTLVALVLATSVATPNAEANHYSRSDISCSDNAAGNAVAGVIVGGVLGAILGGANNNPGLGAAIGAAAGGGIGLGLSCREQTVYIDNVDRYLDGEDYDNPYRWRGGSVRVTREFERPDGTTCEEYLSMVNSPRGQVQHREVACYEDDQWVHGYESESHQYRVVRTYGSTRYEERHEYHRETYSPRRDDYYDRDDEDEDAPYRRDDYGIQPPRR